MSGSMTNVPAPTFGPTGFVAPTLAAVLAGVDADFVGAIGSGLNTALETPQGQLISSEAAIIGDKDSQFLFLASQMDPAFAEGRFQDALGRYYFITRFPSTFTLATCTISGATGVIIPSGTPALAADGNIYNATSTGTISSGGTVSIVFACAISGPIACPANSVTVPGQTIPGWDGITNPLVGAPGSNVETRQAFEYRRALSVEGNANNTNGAVLGAVLSLSDVSDCFVTDNSSSGTATVGGVALNPNSLYVCVYGGTSTEIALAILSKKPPGCGYTGNTPLVVYDPNPIYGGSPPAYQVTWQTAVGLPIYGAVSIPNSTSVPSNAQALITAAFNSAFFGADGLPKVARIGATTFASRFYADIIALGSWAQNIISLAVGTSPGPTSSSVTATIAQVPVPASIALTLV